LRWRSWYSEASVKSGASAVVRLRVGEGEGGEGRS
jgi:hypothetical protein